MNSTIKSLLSCLWLFVKFKQGKRIPFSFDLFSILVPRGDYMWEDLLLINQLYKPEKWQNSYFQTVAREIFF